MAVTGREFHEATTTAGNQDDNEDIRHVQPRDRRTAHVWLFEPPASSGVLTQDGVSQIAEHKYQAGTYTWLDTTLNPIWTHLTEWLPMTVAPNLVTTMGGLHCLISYLATWYFVPQWDGPVPNALLIFNAYCSMAYYTLDCMDGKQARRTGSSSPLGQLFDHGMDCLCLLTHHSTVQAWAMAGGTVGFVTSLTTLLFSFFVAQWEEYHTGVLPHASGQIGVTEVNYSLALASLVNAFLPRSELYTPELLHLLFRGWFSFAGILILLSFQRTLRSVEGVSHKLQALLKLTSPLTLSLVVGFLPATVWQAETRLISLVYGLAMCLVTIKMIVFSMARQAFAVVQFEVLPCVAACLWTTHDPRLRAEGVHLLWQALTVWYTYRIALWTRSAILQICERLDIALFSVAKRSKVD